MRLWIRSLLAATCLALLPLAAPAEVSIGISVGFAPPALPVYEQPAIPGPGYIWVPGYWAYDEDAGYYWVPGTWALAPEVGFLWTPGYWGWSDGFYLWHAGYWGPHVGFYGGINYGYGYGGEGYEGGYWRGRDFYYNRSVNNITNVNITNVYNQTVVNNVTVNRVSYNGGEGGVMARPSQKDMVAEHERHLQPTSAQREHIAQARSDESLRAKVNNGNPPIAATSRPAVFHGQGVVPARGAVAGAGPARSEGTRGASARPDRAANTGLAARDSRGGGSAAVRSDRPPGAAGNGPGARAESQLALPGRPSRAPTPGTMSGRPGGDYAAGSPRTDRPVESRAPMRSSAPPYSEARAPAPESRPAPQGYGAPSQYRPPVRESRPQTYAPPPQAPRAESRMPPPQPALRPESRPEPQQREPAREAPRGRAPIERGGRGR
ncbi:MAG: YXWGXW repeat-containing protein [Gammaproteobacteria bacterium]|nr:YXWGXW repeat-containing protein [Gammaproteobacteria bacterium]